MSGGKVLLLQRKRRGKFPRHGGETCPGRKTERVFLLGHQQRGIGSEFFLGRVGVAGEIYKEEWSFLDVEVGRRTKEENGAPCLALVGKGQSTEVQAIVKAEGQR